MVPPEPEQPAGPRYRALDMLHKAHAPSVKGRGPYWRPPAPDCVPAVRVPAWTWHAPIPADVARVAVLDANAAYLAAASSVEVALGALEHAEGPRPFDRHRPGFWLVSLPTWQHDGIMPPWGTGRVAGDWWLPTPTVDLLEQLAEDGWCARVEIHDAWTSSTPCRLRAWAMRIRDDRARAMATGNTELVAAIKLGYSQAVTMLGTEQGSKIYRPDWSTAIRAQHAASMWRSAWKALQTGAPLLAAGTVDELAYDRERVVDWWRDTERGQHTPIRIDVTGQQLGTFKVKEVHPVVDGVLMDAEA